MSKKQASKNGSKQSTKKESNKSTKPANYETEQQRKAKEKEMIDNLNHENIQKYLMKLDEETKNSDAINKVTIESIGRIAQNLENGSLIIPENSSPLPLKAPIQPKLTYQEQREKESKEKWQIRSKKMQYFYEQIRGENQRVTKKQNSSPVEFKEILTKDEHERRMRQLQQQKQDRQKRLQQLQQEQQRRQKEEQQKQQMNREQQEKKGKEEKRLKIKEQMSKRKEIHDKFLEMQSKLEKQRLAVSQKPILYKEMQEKYKSHILLPYLQEKKSRLKQLRDFKKQYQLDAVRQHEKQYNLKSLQRSREKKNSQVNWKYDPPAKTQRLAKLLQQEESEHLSQLQARKRRIEDMQQRQQIFKEQLKQKFRPKIDESKKKEVEDRLSQEQRKREKLNNATEANPRQFGKQYLEMIRKLKRSQSVKVNPVQSSQLHHGSSKKIETKVSFSRLQNHSQQFYQDVRRKKIEDIVNSEESTMNEKYMMLKMEAEKIGQKLKQKQDLLKIKGSEQDQQDAAQLMLSSIKVKMGIVNLLKKNEAITKKTN